MISFRGHEGEKRAIVEYNSLSNSEPASSDIYEDVSHNYPEEKIITEVSGQEFTGTLAKQDSVIFKQRRIVEFNDSHDLGRIRICNSTDFEREL